MSEAAPGYALPHGCDSPGRISGTCVGHRVEIAAPPALVWDFIADFEGWQAWNPLYVQTSGRAEPGERIRFAVQLEGMKPHKGAAQVVTVRAGELLEYRVNGLGGLSKAFRFVEIEPLSATSCAVTNGEIMGGPVGLLIVRALGGKVGKGLEAMNLALRAVAERKWQGISG